MSERREWSRPPALILGEGVTALGVLRCLTYAGIEAFVLGDQPSLVKHSRWFRPAPETTPCPLEHGLDAYLSASSLESAVLFPCSDRWALAVSHLPASLKRRFPSFVSTPSVLSMLVDKGSFATFLRTAEIPHPDTRLVRDASAFADVAPSAWGSVFLKPCDSQQFFDTFGVKAFELNSPGEAVNVFQRVDKAGIDVLLQEYIPGPPTNHYFIDGFVDATGEVRALFARRRLRMYPVDFGNSTLLVSVPLSDVSGAVASLLRMFRLLSYQGVFSAEFKRDPRDGNFKILEVNTRPWWYVRFAGQCGVNVCELAYRDALGLPLRTITEYQTGRKCVYPYHDYYACRAGGRSRPASVLAWLKSCASALQPVASLLDPLPGIVSGMNMLAHWSLKRVTRRSRRASQPGVLQQPVATAAASQKITSR